MLSTIVVTGATGFVAGHLVPRLRQAFPGAALVLRGEGVKGLDVTDRDAVAALTAEVRPDAWVNLAAISAVPAARSDPARSWAVNLHGALAIAEAIVAHVPGCTLLHPSSAEVYGRSFASSVPLDETALLAPMNVYAATKAAADLALGAAAADGLRVIRMRPFNHTGPGQSETFAIPAFARQITRIAAGQQEPVLRTGALDPRRDFLDVRDVCDAYVAALEQREAVTPGAVFNIASGVSRRIGDVLAELLALAEVKAVVEETPGLRRAVDIPVACGDASLARATLGWAPRVPWATTLGDVLADWRGRT